eukprot:TRINITY_DN6050_c0_g1_i1.p1 TRINITY_DN6050_c0_g1~~TRINITY_DN6050_c0_g1_i1.p1  ORF type:complete len:312 (-),score=60.38 TRINITY_DN6050_c0_g1_i1:1115-1984(-)
MSFIPPFFSKLGEKVKDLFTKGYDYEHQAKVKSAIDPKLSIESAAILKGNNEIGGNSKLKYKPSFGEIEAEVHTKGDASAQIKHTKLTDGLSLIFKAVGAPAAKRAGKFTTEYKRDAFAGTASVNVTEKLDTTTELSAVTGFDGFSFGGQVLHDASAKAAHDFNIGTEYTPSPAYTLTLKTLQQMGQLQFGYIHNIKNDKLNTSVGGTFTYDRLATEPSDMRVFALGADHQIDEKTKVKGSVDTRAILCGMVEHKLHNPNMKVNLSSQWDVKKQSTPTKFGCGLSFGDD